MSHTGLKQLSDLGFHDVELSRREIPAWALKYALDAAKVYGHVRCTPSVAGDLFEIVGNCAPGVLAGDFHE